MNVRVLSLNASNSPLYLVTKFLNNLTANMTNTSNGELKPILGLIEITINAMVLIVPTSSTFRCKNMWAAIANLSGDSIAVISAVFSYLVLNKWVKKIENPFANSEIL